MRHDGPEYTLIAAALTGLPAVADGTWNWDRTVAIAAREEVLTGLYGRLNCPPDVADFLDGAHQLNSVRNQQLLVDLETLSLLLNQAGIEPVLLKGAAYLAAGIYEDPASRLMRDIDMMVLPEQSSAAYELILRTGYEPVNCLPSALVAHHHPMLFKAYHVPVEIHHTVGLGGSDSILTAREVFASSVAIPLGRARVRLPSAEHLTTHLVLHSQLHHGAYSRIWPTLKSMLDLVLLHQRLAPDWRDIRKRFAKHGRSGLLNAHLLQIEKVLGFPAPFPISRSGLRWLRRRILWRETRLRFLDPLYATSRILRSRASLSLRLLKHPLGRKYFLATPFRASFYRNLLRDLR